eukprot:4695964-Pyramimonas_sp.AAC.1
MCCGFVWGQMLELGRLERARRVLRERWQRVCPSWHGARGLVAACWLSLRRVGWGVVSSAMIKSDEGVALSLMQ